MKHLLFLLLFIINISCKAQKKTGIISIGLYSGGNCSEGGSLCGFYWLRKDHSFLFVQGFQGYITSAGIGNWSYGKAYYVEDKKTVVQDSTFQFNFTKLPGLYLFNGNIDYHAETKGSTDSIYVEGWLKGTDGRPVGTATVAFSNGWGTLADTTGHFKLSISFLKATGTIKIIKTYFGYYPTTIDLQPNYNYYRLNVTVPFLGDKPFIPVEEGDSIKLKYGVIKKGSGIQAAPEKVPYLFQLLSEAEKNQPLLKNYFVWLKAELNK